MLHCHWPPASSTSSPSKQQNKHKQGHHGHPHPYHLNHHGNQDYCDHTASTFWCTCRQSPRSTGHGPDRVALSCWRRCRAEKAPELCCCNRCFSWALREKNLYQNSALICTSGEKKTCVQHSQGFLRYRMATIYVSCTELHHFPVPRFAKRLSPADWNQIDRYSCGKITLITTSAPKGWLLRYTFTMMFECGYQRGPINLCRKCLYAIHLCQLDWISAATLRLLPG